MGAQKYGIDVTRVESYARQIKEIAEMGIQIGIVIGEFSPKDWHICCYICNNSF